MLRCLGEVPQWGPWQNAIDAFTAVETHLMAISFPTSPGVELTNCIKYGLEMSMGTR